MKFNPEKLEHFATGGEKEIYKHPHDPERLVVDFRYFDASPAEMKGRYYLTKILNLLFPKTVPDISFAEGGPDASMILERKHLDVDHEKLRDLISRALRMRERGDIDESLDAEIDREEELFQQKLDQDPRYGEFRNKMMDMGIIIDTQARNFGYDQQGNLLYIDNDFLPWAFDPQNHLQADYDKEKLLIAIESLQGPDREKAKVYYDRLDELYKEEAANQRNQN